MPHADPEKRRAYARERYKRKGRKTPQVPTEAQRTRAREHAIEKWRSLSHDEQKSIALRQKYGITIERKREMCAQQDGRCAICRVTFESETAAHVDHDHAHESCVERRRGHRTISTCKAEAVRSLLCYKCNNALGSFGDSLELLTIAIRYLCSHKMPALHALGACDCARLLSC